MVTFPKQFDSGIIIVDARNPRYTATGLINLTVHFEHLGPDIPFTADPNDSEYGAWLFDHAKAGDFGPVTPYTASADEVRNQVKALTEEASGKIAVLQIEVNNLQYAVELGMATPEEAARLEPAKAELLAWKRYSVLLSRVEGQPGFPASVQWPQKP